MRKYHDQVLRNIYKLVIDPETGLYNDPDIHAELLTSCALPAHCYVAGFKNLQHAYGVCVNEQHTTIKDITFIVDHLLKLLNARTYKQQRMPLAFHKFITTRLSVLNTLLADGYYHEALANLTLSIERLEIDWGYTKQRELIQQYEKENPAPSIWYHNLDPMYQDYWKKYFAYKRTIQFGACWRYWSILRHLEMSLSTILEKKGDN